MIECLVIPFVCCFRALVQIFPCLFKHSLYFSTPLTLQFEKASCISGGWHSDQSKTYISVRDTFFTMMATLFQEKPDTKNHLRATLQKISRQMLNTGQVPYEFRKTWFDNSAPVYISDRRGVPVIDANIQYIIMTWWLYQNYNMFDQKQYLYCQRAWEWIENHILQDAVLEPEDASWETTRAGGGALLLTNVMATKAIRCMELLSIVRQDSQNAMRFQHMHKRFLSRWVNEIYKTQQTLPKILAIAWNMVPDTFIESFQQQIHNPWMPLWLDGPLKMPVTTHARLYGQSDIHTTIVWPWVGLLWVCVLVDKHKYDLAKTWWASYLEFHRPHTLYDMYTKHGEPVRRAFVRAKPAHTLTLGMQIAAKHCTDNIGHC